MDTVCLAEDSNLANVFFEEIYEFVAEQTLSKKLSAVEAWSMMIESEDEDDDEEEEEEEEEKQSESYLSSYSVGYHDDPERDDDFIVENSFLYQMLLKTNNLRFVKSPPPPTPPPTQSELYERDITSTENKEGNLDDEDEEFVASEKDSTGLMTTYSVDYQDDSDSKKQPPLTQFELYERDLASTKDEEDNFDLLWL